ncbi:VOC family protein [Rhizobium oryzicola]|uniref:VOC family protein n=1 Tax=Rhizobium oryzicola TaxID=1232668 RepID=A0ABT8SX70_9HYPH|nr:VOC family protein [Rhizobium oryzicola]MDO1582591.1 VOC family protein [Rhizobium oryzicola]
MPRTYIDHFIYGGASIELIEADVRSRFGVAPQAGGSHQGRGTRNSFIHVEWDDETNNCFLELIGPDLMQGGKGAVGTYFKAFPKPRLDGFSVWTPDIEVTKRLLQQEGFTIRPEPFTRMRPDGILLSWNVIHVEGHDLGKFIPFFMDRSPEDGPASTATPGCSLLAFRVRHPQAERLNLAYRAMGLRVIAEPSKNPSLELSLMTPQGLVELTSE